MPLCKHNQTAVPPMATLINYKMKTTFWLDFNIADRFGLDAIKDTYNRAFNEWKNDTVYCTELIMVLNWKSWEHSYEKNGVPVCDEIGSWYADKYYELKHWCYDNWKDKDAIDYLVRTTD